VTDQPVDGRQTPALDRQQPPTIYDIARATGFSASTVSRALHKPGRVGAATRGTIQETAAALGYRTNTSARALLTGRTGTFGLLVSDITNPVFFDLIRGAEQVTGQAGRTLVLGETRGDAELELTAASRLLTSVDGLVLVASRLADDDVRRLAARKPLVLANRALDGVTSVVPDAAAGVTAVVDHVVGLGHRAIAFLTGPDSWVSDARWQQIFDTAVARDVSIVEIRCGSTTVEGGRGSLPRVLAAGVTAVLAYNDLIAIGLLQACRDEAVAVPERLSIVGHDDIFGSDFTTPALTTVRIPFGPIGEQSVRRLLGRLDENEGDDVGRLAPSAPLGAELVVRGSTGPAPT
jgi:LacI family transcriptional regulator